MSINDHDQNCIKLTVEFSRWNDKTEDYEHVGSSSFYLDVKNREEQRKVRYEFRDSDHLFVVDETDSLSLKALKGFLKNSLDAVVSQYPESSVGMHIWLNNMVGKSYYTDGPLIPS